MHAAEREPAAPTRSARDRHAEFAQCVDVAVQCAKADTEIFGQIICGRVLALGEQHLQLLEPGHASAHETIMPEIDMLISSVD